VGYVAISLSVCNRMSFLEEDISFTGKMHNFSVTTLYDLSRILY